MVFATISEKQATQYAYICTRLKCMVNDMCMARKTLEALAHTSFDKSFAKCVYMLTSEIQQCENEIRAQIDCLNCCNYEDDRFGNEKFMPVNNIHEVNDICAFFEKTYLKPYKKLLKDKHMGDSLKSLIQNHFQLFKSSLTQLKLFDDVTAVMN